MRILLTGAAGQVGLELADAFADHEVVALDRAALDVGDRDQVWTAVTAAGPDAVVHAAAWTDVDGCEDDPDRAFRVNAIGTRHVADAARAVGAHVCYLSTDYVFDGRASAPYREWDATEPLSVYGRSKLGGERELFPGSTVVRTSWVCGRHGRNIVKTVLRLAAEHDRLRFVDDQRGSPTFTADLAPAIRRLVVERRPGTFHVTNQGDATWYELARGVLEAAGGDPGRVDPITAAELGQHAARPAYSVLDNAALRLSGLDLLPDYRESLQKLVAELTS